jgi:hypothetical protein
VREVERLQEEKQHDRKDFVGRSSCTDPDAHVMRNGEGGAVPSYNVQLLTDVTYGLVLNVEATTDAIDYRQLQPARSNRCERTLGKKPKQVVADGDYTNSRRCKWRQLAGWTLMDRGKTAGNQSNAMSKAAAPSSWPARFRTMPSATASPVLSDRPSLNTQY